MTIAEVGGLALAALAPSLAAANISGGIADPFAFLACWPLPAAGFATLAAAIARTGRWWLPAIIPAFTARFAVGGLLLLACQRGDCL